jgi:hypothetical protein
MVMTLKLHLWVLTVFVPAASPAVITCTAGTASIPVFNPSSISGAVGNYTLDCTGGTPVSPPAPSVNFTSFMNASVLNTGGWILTDGVNNFAGILSGNSVTFLSVPFNPPGTGHLFWTVENIFVNPNGKPPGSQFLELLSITGSILIGIDNPVQVVAVNAVPEPSTLLLAGVALAAMLWLGHRRPTGPHRQSSPLPKIE